MDADAPGATATLRVYGTLRPDGKDMVQLGSDIAMDTTTGTHYVNGLINTDAWAYIQVVVAAIAGTNPRVNGWMLAA